MSERILITDYFCAANRGDAATVEGMLHSLRTCCPDASFVVHSSYPDLVPLVHGVEARYDLCKWVPRPVARASASYLMMWARVKRGGTELPLPHKTIRDTLRDHEEADIVVAKGGGYLRDYYHDCMLRLWSLRIATILGKTVHDYVRYTFHGLRRLFEPAGFADVDIKPVGGLSLTPSKAVGSGHSDQAPRGHFE